MPEQFIPENYSRFSDLRKEMESDIADTELLIEEIKTRVGELKRDRQAALENNEYAQTHGLAENDISKIDGWILEAEQSLADFEKIRSGFTGIAGDLKRLREKSAGLLTSHKSSITH